MTGLPYPEEFRIAFSWNEDGLTRVRTHARKPLIWRCPVPSAIEEYSQVLIAPENSGLYHWDCTQYLPRKTEPASRTELDRALVAGCPEYAGIPEESRHMPDWALCRRVSFHKDDVQSKASVYLVWVLALSAPMRFISVGINRLLEVGDVIVFDAESIHGLVAAGQTTYAEETSDTSHRMLFVLGGLKLEETLAERMGIELMPCPDRFRSLDTCNYCESTGLLNSDA